MAVVRWSRDACPAGMDRKEWVARVELTECYHAFEYLAWTESVFNHITLRVPGPERHYLINPFGLTYDEITPDNLIKIDLDGQPVEPSAYPVNRAGFIIHSAIHRARDDAHCIIHTHTDTGLAVACTEGGLSYDNFYGAQLYGRVAYHDFEAITVREDEQPRLVKNLGDKPVLILRNHGLLVAERNVAQAFRLFWTLQRACDIQWRIGAMGGTNIPLSESVRRSCVADAANFADALAEKMLDAVLRKAAKAG